MAAQALSFLLPLMTQTSRNLPVLPALMTHEIFTLEQSFTAAVITAYNLEPLPLQQVASLSVKKFKIFQVATQMIQDSLSIAAFKTKLIHINLKPMALTMSVLLVTTETTPLTHARWSLLATTPQMIVVASYLDKEPQRSKSALLVTSASVAHIINKMFKLATTPQMIVISSYHKEPQSSSRAMKVTSALGAQILHKLFQLALISRKVRLKAALLVTSASVAQAVSRSALLASTALLAQALKQAAKLITTALLVAVGKQAARPTQPLMEEGMMMLRIVHTRCQDFILQALVQSARALLDTTALVSEGKKQTS